MPHAPPPPAFQAPVVVGPWERQMTVTELWNDRDTRAIFQLKVRTLFQNGFFQYDQAFDVWNNKFKILLVELEKAYKSFQKVIENQAKKDARAKQLAMKIGFTVLSIGLSSVGLGVVGELIRHAISSEGANLFASCIQETVVEVGKVASHKLGETITEKIKSKLSLHVNAKSSLALKQGVHRLNDIEGELERLQESLTVVIREMKLKYAYVVTAQTAGLADDKDRLEGTFKRIVRLVALRHGRPYQQDNQTRCSKNELHDAIDQWVSQTRRQLDQELTRLFYCPHDQARNNRAETKKSLEKMLWAEWIIAQAEGKTEIPRHALVHRLSGIGGDDVYRSSNFRIQNPDGNGMSVLKNVGSEVTNELIRLGVVEWRDQRYSSFRSQAERRRIEWEHQQEQSHKVFTGKSIRGQIGGDRAKARLVLWAHQYLQGEPLKEALGVQANALENVAVLQDF